MSYTQTKIGKLREYLDNPTNREAFVEILNAKDGTVSKALASDDRLQGITVNIFTNLADQSPNLRKATLGIPDSPDKEGPGTERLWEPPDSERSADHQQNRKPTDNSGYYTGHQGSFSYLQPNARLLETKNSARAAGGAPEFSAHESQYPNHSLHDSFPSDSTDVVGHTDSPTCACGLCLYYRENDTQTTNSGRADGDEAYACSFQPDSAGYSTMGDLQSSAPVHYPDCLCGCVWPEYQQQ